MVDRLLVYRTLVSRSVEGRRREESKAERGTVHVHLRLKKFLTRAHACDMTPGLPFFREKQPGRAKEGGIAYAEKRRDLNGNISDFINIHLRVYLRRALTIAP